MSPVIQRLFFERQSTRLTCTVKWVFLTVIQESRCVGYYIPHLQPSPLQRYKCLVQNRWLPGTAACVTSVTSSIPVCWTIWKSCWKEENKHRSSTMASLILFDIGKTYQNQVKKQQEPYHPTSKSLGADTAFSNTSGSPQDKVYGPSFAPLEALGFSSCLSLKLSHRLAQTCLLLRPE